MGSGISRKRKDKECQRCYHFAETSAQHDGCVLEASNNGLPSAEGNNTTKKFFPYPQKTADQDEMETKFISTSEFPYSKPKAVTVRPRPVEIVAPQSFNSQLRQSNLPRDNATNNVHGQQFLLNNECHPNIVAGPSNLHGAISEPYCSRKPHRSYQFVNQQRGSYPGVMPTTVPNKKPLPNSVLVHRTVLELRHSNQVQPYGRHYSYVCDMEPSEYPVGTSEHTRPPTPTPHGWYPANRTSDYLVASSLLAMEQERDRQKNKYFRVHNY